MEVNEKAFRARVRVHADMVTNAKLDLLRWAENQQGSRLDTFAMLDGAGYTMPTDPLANAAPEIVSLRLAAAEAVCVMIGQGVLTIASEKLTSAQWIVRGTYGRTVSLDGPRLPEAVMLAPSLRFVDPRPKPE